MRVPWPRPRSLAGQLFAMQVVLVAAVLGGSTVFSCVTLRAQAEDSARHRTTAAATAVARAPSVRAAIRTPHPTERLQPYAEAVRRASGVTFVTIMDRNGIRWTHPEPDRIGRRFSGHFAAARQGRTFHETYTGTLGRSVRVVTPIRDGGRIVGMVGVGITVEKISAELQRQVAALTGVAAAALALGGLGTYIINARLRRHTHGMNTTELSRMYDYHEAALHAVREGLLLLDGERRVALVNDGARRLLGLEGPDVVGRHVTDLGLPASLAQTLLAAGPRVDEVHLTEERVVVVNTSEVSGGERHGTVVTLRDHTELQSLAGELDSVRCFAEALRSQAHEAAGRLHTVVSLIELGRAEEAVEFATCELELAQALTDQVVSSVADPVPAALLLGKTAQAHERGVELMLTPDSRITGGTLSEDIPARDLVTVLGNLIDNAVDAAAESGPRTEPGGSGDAGRPDRRPRVTVTVRVDDCELLIRVADNGPGIPQPAAEKIFRRGWTTKPAGAAGRGLGLALVRQAVRRNGGTAEVGEAPGGGAEFTVRLPLHTARVPV